jgi:hypothetical protein
VEAQVEALPVTVDEDTPVHFGSCDVSKKYNTLNYERPVALIAFQMNVFDIFHKTSVHSTHLFDHCLRSGHFPVPWKDAKVIILPKPGKEPKYSPNLRPFNLLSTTGKLSEKVVLRTIRKHT